MRQTWERKRRVLNIRVLAAITQIVRFPSPSPLPASHSRYYNVSYILAGACAVAQSGAATSEQFISLLPPVEISFRRGKSDGCWGVALLRENVRNTRSAVKVECLRCRTLYTPLPPPSYSRPFWIQFSIKLAVDAACPFELVMRV